MVLFCLPDNLPNFWHKDSKHDTHGDENQVEREHVPETGDKQYM